MTCSVCSAVINRDRAGTQINRFYHVLVMLRIEPLFGLTAHECSTRVLSCPTNEFNSILCWHFFFFWHNAIIYSNKVDFMPSYIIFNFLYIHKSIIHNPLGHSSIFVNAYAFALLLTRSFHWIACQNETIISFCWFLNFMPFN